MVKEVNGLYVVEDSTGLGYVDRMSTNPQQYWETHWDKNFNLLYFKKDNRYNMLDVLNDKEDWDYRRAVLARNRHLRALKEYLGLDTGVKKVEKPVKEFIMFSPYYDCTRKPTITLETSTETPKMIGRYNKSFIQHYTLATPKKKELAQEYNRKLEEFKAYEAQIFKQIFSGDGK